MNPRKAFCDAFFPIDKTPGSAYDGCLNFEFFKKVIEEEDRWGAWDWFFFSLMILMVVISVLGMKFLKRWGSWDNFIRALNSMKELHEAIGLVDPERVQRALDNEIEKLWERDADTRRKFYRESSGPIITETILGSIILIESPFVVHQIMRTYMDQARRRWEAMVQKEYA